MCSALDDNSRDNDPWMFDLICYGCIGKMQRIFFRPPSRRPSFFTWPLLGSLLDDEICV